VISVHQLRLALRKESRSWRNNLKTDFILGVLRGLAIAVAIVDRMCQEEKTKQRKTLPPLTDL
jgi:hypothetical protein